ncbi:hypothetical protein Tco_0271621 [Tanacetum coccineum]
MSSTSAHQQALVDVGFETRLPMLEIGSYVSWSSRFRRYIDQKRETRKFLRYSIDEGPYQMKDIQATDTRLGRPQTEDDLTSYEKLVNDSRAKRAAKTHDPLALVANTYARDEVCDDQEYSITTALMLLARAITQHYSTPTNKSLHTSSNTRNQAVVQADRVNIQSINVGNGGRFERRSSNIQGNLLRVKMFRRRLGIDMYRELYELLHHEMLQMFSATTTMLKKDEAAVILSVEQNDFLLADATQMEELEELSVDICMMDRIQKAYSDSKSIDKFHESINLPNKLDETVTPNEILKDRLLEATLIHDVEICVLMRFDSKDDNLKDEIKKVKRESIYIQENLLCRNVDVKDALKAKVDVLCVSCKKNVLTLYHDKCLAKYKLSVKSNIRRALFTILRIAKTNFVDTTPLVATTRVRRSGAQGCKTWRPSCIAWSGGQGWWSGGQDVGVVPKGVAWGKKVPGQMTHFVASLTLDSAKSCVMQGASCTQRKGSSVPFVFSTPFVLSWGGSISPDSFLSSILLLVVMVVIVVVTVILVVVVVAIIGVVIVVTIIRVVVVVIVGGVPSIIKLSFVFVGSLHRTML